MLPAWRSESWIAACSEQWHPGQQTLLGIERILYRARSPWQTIIIAEVPVYGRALFLDGDPQLLEHDEWIYHEHLALPPLLFHPAPQRVLILGGGDGLALREVLRDTRVAQATLVDIDALVVEACRQHLAELQRGSLDDARARVVIDDARTFLARSTEQFDVALVDLTDVTDAAGLALLDEVLAGLQPRLAAGAIVSAQVSALDAPWHRALRLEARLRRHFRHTALHRAYIPSFVHEWGFALAANDVDLLHSDAHTLAARVAFLDAPPRSLRAEDYPAALRLPPYLEELRQRMLDTPVAPEGGPALTWLERPTS